MVTLPCYCEVIHEDDMSMGLEEALGREVGYVWSRVAIKADRIVGIQELTEQDWFYGEGVRVAITVSTESQNVFYHSSISYDELVSILEDLANGFLFRKN